MLKETYDVRHDRESSILIKDISKYGIDLALAEELTNLRSFEDAEALAREAIELASHTHESDNRYVCTKKEKVPFSLSFFQP